MKTKQKKFVPLIFIGMLTTTMFFGCTTDDQERIPFIVNVVAPANLPEDAPELNLAALTATMTNQQGRTFQGNLNAEGSVTLFVDPGVYSITVAGQITMQGGEIATIQGAVGTFTVARDGVLRTSETNNLAAAGNFDLDELGVTETHFLNEITVRLSFAYASELIIREIFFGGGPRIVSIENGDTTFTTWQRDQYIEVFNNSNRVVYLDSLIIGNLAPANSLASNPWNDLEGKVAFFGNMWMVPGTGICHPLQPGEGAVFAPEAMDHGAYPTRALSGLDLSRVHFAMFNAQQHTGGTEPAPGVTLLEMLTAPAGNRWTMSVGSPAVVIARIPNFYEEWWSRISEFHVQQPGSTAATRHWIIREEWIIDGIDVTTPAVGLGATKRVPRHIDASVVWLENGNAVGDALTRRLDRVENGRHIYQVTRNSYRDFVTARPNPRLRP